MSHQCPACPSFNVQLVTGFGSLSSGPECSWSCWRKNSRTDTEETLAGAGLLMQRKAERKCAFQTGVGRQECAALEALRPEGSVGGLGTWGQSVLQNWVMCPQLLPHVPQGTSWPWMVIGCLFVCVCVDWGDLGSARPCYILLLSAVWDVIPHQHQSHSSQPSGFLTPTASLVIAFSRVLPDSKLELIAQFLFGLSLLLLDSVYLGRSQL
jgi:hypothetical protein